MNNLLMTGLLLTASGASARTFYETTVALSGLEYFHIDHGSLGISFSDDDRPSLDIRFSDDRQHCIARNDQIRVPCTVSERDEKYITKGWVTSGKMVFYTISLSEDHTDIVLGHLTSWLESEDADMPTQSQSLLKTEHFKKALARRPRVLTIRAPVDEESLASVISFSGGEEPDNLNFNYTASAIQALN